MFGDENIIELKVDDSNIKRAGWHLPSSIFYMEDMGCLNNALSGRRFHPFQLSFASYAKDDTCDFICPIKDIGGKWSGGAKTI